MTFIALCPLERWPLYDKQVPAAASRMRDQIQMAANLECQAVNIPLSDKFNYFLEPNGSIQSINRGLHDFARSLGLDTLQSGPALFKHWFNGRRLTLPTLTGDIQTVQLGDSKTIDPADGRVFFPELAQRLNSEDTYRILRLKVISAQPGTLYFLTNNDKSVMNKFAVSGSQTKTVPYIPLPGQTLTNIAFVSSGERKGRVTFPSMTRNEIGGSGSVEEHQRWIGTNNDGFLHCRIADPAYCYGQIETCLEAKNYIHNVTQVVISDEINSPLGYDLDPVLYPHGWPQWAGEYMATWNHASLALTGRACAFMQPDPRTNLEDLRHNRCCAVVPEGSNPDPLYWMSRRTTNAGIGIWGEQAPAAHWRANYERVTGYGFESFLMIYAGLQDFRHVVEAIPVNELNDMMICVYYWERERPHAAATVNQIKQLLA